MSGRNLAVMNDIKISSKVIEIYIFAKSGMEWADWVV